MINRKNLIKIFIVFFIVNIFYFLICRSYALSVTPSVSSLELNLEKTKNTEVTVESKNSSTSSGYTTVLKHLASSSSSKSSSGSGTKKSNTVLVDTDILREDFANEFDPNSKTGGYNISNPVIKVIIPVVAKILNILQVIGAIVLVISLAIAGFNGVLGAGDGFSEDLGLNVGKSVNDYGIEVSGVQNLTKGSLSKIIRRALIGSLILESSLTIVRIVFAICTNL